MSESLILDQTMDKISKKIVNGLDKVEGHFLGKDIHFLAVDIDEVPDLQVASVPSLIYFKNGDPIVYEENLMNEEAIRTWVDSELKSNFSKIHITSHVTIYIQLSSQKNTHKPAVWNS